MTSLIHWKIVGPDIYGRAIYRADFGPMCWGVVQEFTDRWAWELNMPDARDDQRGRAVSMADAMERVATAAMQRGMVDAMERDHEREERIAIQTEDAAQVAALADATLERVHKWNAMMGAGVAVERAVAEERAAIVAWLRGPCIDGVIEEACMLAADAIERGEHREEKA